MKNNDITENFDNRPIGFFDSGVGGLTVLKKVKEILPNEKYLYFGDTKNMPYGEKTEDELLKFADDIFKFFEKKDVKAVVMACNTTSAVTYEKLKNKYSFKIYPIIQTVSKVLSNMDLPCIGIVATPATINSHCYQKSINRNNSRTKVVEVAAKSWVKFVENSQIETTECKNAIKEILDEIMKENPSKIVLGCTHYPYLLKVITQFACKELFIDPAVYFAEAVSQDLTKQNLISYSKIPQDMEFYVSANPDKFKFAAKRFFNLEGQTITVHEH